MSVKSIRLNDRNLLASDYVKGKLRDFFTYQPFAPLNDRIEHLRTRTYPRNELVSLLTETNKHWGADESTLQQIERLKYDDAVVVVGGQQAGLFTGPLYTVHKIISIIKFAKQQEEKLNVPVIPLFWIAGEDHDYDEINHIYTISNNDLNKRKIQQEEWIKRSISDIELDKELLELWIKQVLNDLIETEHTKSLVTKILHQAEKSVTFVDFFARIVFELFRDEGIVLLDSANEQLRQLESEWFEKLIKQQAQITQAVYNTAQQIHQSGYSVQVDVERNDGNLFYHDEQNERILLVRENSNWIGKNNEVLFTTEELLAIAKNEPQRLSNNVITRPLMQEAMLPTLAFIAGDGEISYWALLKDAFKEFDEKFTMPPVIPRLSITLINERIDKLLNERSLDEDYIVNNGCKMLKLNWLSTQKNPPVNLIFEEAKANVAEIHKPLQELALSIGPDLLGEAERNLRNILEEISYLEQKTLQHIKRKYSFELDQFQEINLALRPKNSLQERVLNVFSFLNECGESFIKELIELDLSVTEDHQLIYLHKLQEK